LYEDHDKTVESIEKFLDVGSERLERARNEKPGTFSTAHPVVPDHLAMTKHTPHDLCDAVSNYEAFCRKYSKDKQWVHDLVNPCAKLPMPSQSKSSQSSQSKSSVLSAWEMGKCCQCEFRSSGSKEEPLDQELNAKLQSLQQQHEKLVKSSHTPTAAELDAIKRRQKEWALQVERNRRDDDDMADAAPGRVDHLDLHVALRNSAKQMPSWMEAP